MSSKKSSKADLLVRVRYQNPLPPPPFPPKLLAVATDPARYATYDFLLPLAAERELPMVVDAELGMPLEVGKDDDGYWTGDFSTIAPDTAKRPILHDDDAALLVEPAGGVSASATGLLNPTSHPTAATNLPTVDRKKAEVSWLRRTEYLASDSAPRRETSENRMTPAKRAPRRRRTKIERISAINATFAAASTPLTSLRHPTRRDLHAVDEHPILPDSVPKDQPYSLLRFTDDPLERKPGDPGGQEMASISQAFFRVVTVPGEASARITLYLSKDPERTRALKHLRVSATDLDNAEEAEFRHARDFEPQGVREMRNEFLMVFDDPLSTVANDVFDEYTSVQRQKAAYLSPIGRLDQLRKRRRHEWERHQRAGYGEAAEQAGIELWHSLGVVWTTGGGGGGGGDDEEALAAQPDQAGLPTDSGPLDPHSTGLPDGVPNP